MRDYIKSFTIRASKFIHFLLSIGLFIAYCWNVRQPLDLTQFYSAIAIYVVIFLFSLRTYNAYNVGLSRISLLVYSQTLSSLLPIGVVYLLHALECMTMEHMTLPNPLPLLAVLGIQFVFNCLWCLVANFLYFRLHQPKRTVLVYSDESDLLRMAEIHQHSRIFRIDKSIQQIGDDIRSLAEDLEHAQALFVGNISPLARNEILEYCVEHNIRCYILPRVGDVLLMGGKHQEAFSIPVFRVMRSCPPLEYLAFKRFIDILASLLGIILLSPFMLITALAIKLYDRGPVIYKQVRLTKDGREFKILKFRSMRVDAERDGVARLSTTHDDRITPVGKVIRAIRFDELPQLFNILKGDMTIVGPRPERPEIARQYQQQLPDFSLRLQVKAGLTGLAQVYGKYNTDPCDKLRMDLMYINRMSFLYDIQLMLATVKVLFMKESTSGIADGQTTASLDCSEQEQNVKEYAVK